MKKQILVTILLINMISCKSQIKNDSNKNLKKETMEVFDINNYKNLPPDIENSSANNDLFYLKDENKKIRITTDVEIIRVEESSKISPYKIIKIYSSKTKILLVEGKQFYNISMGIDKEYYEKTKSIKETNHDKPYKLSIKDLIEKFNKEYKIDIENPEKVLSINRNVGTNEFKNPFYEVILKKDLPNTYDCYLINGNTGDTLYLMLLEKGERKKLLEEYLKSLKQKKEDKAKIFTTHKGKNYTEEEWRKYEEELYQKDKNKKK